MQRRTFLSALNAAGLGAAARLRLLADTPMPMTTLGKTGLRVSRFVVGGYHMRVKGEDTATRSSTAPSTSA